MHPHGIVRRFGLRRLPNSLSKKTKKIREIFYSEADSDEACDETRTERSEVANCPPVPPVVRN